MTSDEMNTKSDSQTFTSSEEELSDLFEIACHIRDGQVVEAAPLSQGLSDVLHLLDCVDESWIATPSEIDHVRALFLQKLAVQHPDHPWVRDNSVQTLGQLYNFSKGELPVLPEDASRKLSEDQTPVKELLDVKQRTKVLGLALRTAAVPQKFIGELVMGINKALTAVMPLSSGQQNFVFARRQRGKRGSKR